MDIVRRVAFASNGIESSEYNQNFIEGIIISYCIIV